MKLSVSSGFRSYFRGLVLAFLFVTIATAGFAQCPVPATCIPGNPPAANLIFGMGILNVNLNNGAINNTTPAVSAATGYVDYACTTGTTLTSTIPYPISIQTNNNGNENVRVWLDLDNNGAFNQTSELLFNSNNAKLHTGTFIIPASALTGVPLRLRIAADSYTSPVPTPCSTPQFSQTEDYRITVISNTMAPVAAFTASNTTTCAGTVSFTDNSQNGPTSWLWNFDDPGSGANNTSTLQNPTHTFSSHGTYDIRLIVNNANGTDTLIKTNYILYQAGITTAAACLPATIRYCCGNGITNVNFGNGLMTNSSANGAAGYQDFTCTKSITVTAGNKYPIVLTGGTQPQDFRIYIDLNNDGSFTGTNEKVKEIFSAVNPSDSISIPGTTFINMPLRMRIISDELGSNFTSCGSIQSGQAEDYTIIIQPNPNKPIALFTSTYAAACDTIVNFYDKSLNGPTSWLWDFGDPASGAANTSTLQNPTHIYHNSGVYTVTLTATNSNGNSILTKTNYVRIYKPCLTYCSLGGHNNTTFWITNVSLNNLNHNSPLAGNNYSDFTAQAATVFLGTSPLLSVTRGGNPANFSVSAWIDFNRNNVFDSTEKVMGMLQNNSSTVAAVPINIPATALPGATRMRIIAMSLSHPNNDPCFNNQIGGLATETEDYTILIQSAQQPPVIDFTVLSQLTCSGTVNFNDNTINNPTSWLWNFGDLASGANNTSTLQNPTHIYSSPGLYTVTLTSTNSFGPATVVRTNYITYDPLNPSCSNIVMPAIGTATTATGCTGTVSDPGGPFNPYPNSANSNVTIAPTGAATVTLNFSTFNLQPTFDLLRIYDGPSVASPLLGTFSGTMLPNGGAITSSGSTLTLHFSSNGTIIADGFTAAWTCNLPTTKPASNFIPNLNNVCSGSIIFQDKSANVPTSWLWTFGDPASGAADTSFLQNPTHIYPTGTSGNYTVTLIACNSFGCDTIVKTNFINIPVPCQTYCIANGHNNLNSQWIGNVTMAGLNNSTGPEINGYGNYTYLNAIPMLGTSSNAVTVTLGHRPGGTRYVAIWIDLNKDGIFQTTERVFNKQAIFPPAPGIPVATGTLTIPGNAQPGLTRMRVFMSGEAFLTDPCAINLNPGDVEDYLVNIQINSLPPQADFTSDQNALCTTGTVQFTNATINGATSWFWDFGDPASGTANTSTLQNPSHNYSTATPGNYQVTLIACKGAICDTLIRPNYINITIPCVTYCSSYAQNNSNQWISRVNIGSVNNASGQESTGYGNYTYLRTNLTAGTSIPLTVDLGSTIGNLFVLAWIDFDKDGVFQATEQVFNKRQAPPFPSGYYSVSDNITIPANVTAGPTRLRIIANNDNFISPCATNFSQGETEDYSILILPAQLPPVADFSASPRLTCNGQVAFTDLSTNGPTSWTWNFGDPVSGAANSSSLKNPTHTFSAPGIYNISLSVSNANGPNMITKSNYINYDPTYPTCHQIPMPMSGYVTVTNCTGIIYDDGGPTNNYANNTNGTIVIAPTGASSVSLTFTQFNVETGADILRIYDGSSASAPLIGTYTGTGIPNSGTPIISSGGALTVVFNTSATINDAGFSADWLCSYPVGVVENTSVPIFEIYPNPSKGNVNLKLRNKRSDQFRLEVMNVLGQVQVQKPVNLSQADAYPLDLSSLAKGVYFIRLWNDKISEIRKIVLE